MTVHYTQYSMTVHTKKMNPTTHRSLQKEYFALKKKYKKQVKLMHKKYKNDLINEINARSQDVWRQINKLRKESRVEEETLISPEAWIQHFRQLLYDNDETKKKVFADDSDETDLSDDEILGKPKTNKKGDRRSPANYREITLTLSCLSKLCTGWINISKSITFSSQNNSDSEKHNRYIRFKSSNHFKRYKIYHAVRTNWNEVIIPISSPHRLQGP